MCIAAATGSVNTVLETVPEIVDFGIRATAMPRCYQTDSPRRARD